MLKKIYIAEDEKHIGNLEQVFLEKSGFEVTVFEQGLQLIAAFENEPADLLILDIMLPDIDGLQVCSKIRESCNVPIIVVSAKDSETDKITGIMLGCDDYITKPFSPVELVVRVQAIFRRMDMNNSSVSDFKKNEDIYGDLHLDKKRLIITKGDVILNLTPTEYSVLLYLIENQDKAVSRDEMLNKVWNFSLDTVDTRATDDTMKRLRKKLLEAKSCVKIETLRGFGFRIGVEKDA